MAQHIPIGEAGFQTIIDVHFTKEKINSLVDFERNFNNKLNCTIQKLPVNEYRMDEEHNKVDELVVYFYRVDEDNYSYEVHLDENLKVNEVYLVL